MIRTIEQLKKADPGQVREVMDIIRSISSSIRAMFKSTDQADRKKWLAQMCRHYHFSDMEDRKRHEEDSGKWDSTGRGKGILHPSKLGGCLLQCYWDLIGEEKSGDFNTTDDILLLDAGTTMHLMFQSYFIGLFPDSFLPEVSMEGSKRAEDLCMPYGHTDGVYCEYEPEDFRSLVEVKTIGNDSFKNLDGEIMDHHKSQVLSYMWCSNIPFTTVVYGNRNTGEFITVPYVFDQGQFNELVKERVDLLKIAREKGEAPPANPGFMRCKSCGYSRGCPSTSIKKKPAKV